MEWNNNMMYLSDDEIKVLAMYLAYGAGIGVFMGIFSENIPLYFSLGSVVGIVVSIIVCIINKQREKFDLN
ncbi:MAG: hypothetical protein RSG52_08330 [Terrisporobacter sp.]|uniref:hypothetical protein n=1 Tax=Terrisporobacter sp. TaxID=1965305 RepID=UPI002FC7DCAB